MSESPRQTSEVSSVRSWLRANLHSSEVVCAGRYTGKTRSDAEFRHGVSTLSDSRSAPADESPRHHIDRRSRWNHSLNGSAKWLTQISSE